MYLMKFKFLFISLLFSCNSFSQSSIQSADSRGWEQIYDHKDLIVYIQTESVQAVTNSSGVTTGFNFVDLTNYKLIPEGDSFPSSWSHFGSVDCLRLAYKNNGTKSFNKYFAKGSSVDYPPSKWVDIASANETAKSVIRYFCGR